MVCAKCQKLSKETTLATPRVKKKSEMYLGSPAGSSTSATTGQNGVGKVRCFFALLVQHTLHSMDKFGR